MPVDPIVTLASSIQGAPGVYAVLLGSGVSRPAQIPSGFEVALQMISRVAAAEGAEIGDDAEGWYRERFGGEPDYSVLLEALAPTPAGRRDLLADYFEPTSDEREQGIKTPTAAHRAVARLVSLGFIKVIVTTNFDHLIEQALEDLGIRPQIIATPDQAAGATPLVHARCTIVKPNGDYLDQRLKNTAAELAQYEPPIEQLLDQVIDQFGLIICGWSATYDTGLVGQLLRGPGRRYGTFWCARAGAVDPVAQRIIDHRAATVVPVDDADSFFVDVTEKVESIDRLKEAPPLTTAVAVQTLKRYLPDPRHVIDLSDLVRKETEALVSAHAGLPEPPDLRKEGYLERLANLRSITDRCVHLIANGVYYGGTDQGALWTRMIGRALNHPHHQDSEPEPDSDRFPALLLLYSAGTAAVVARRETFIHELLTEPSLRRRHGGPLRVLDALYYHRVFNARALGEVFRPEQQPTHTFKLPVPEFLARQLREPFRELVPNDDEYNDAFNRFETLLALIQLDQAEHGWRTFSPGRFCIHTDRFSDDEHGSGPLADLARELTAQESDWPLLRGGAFGGDPVAAREALDGLKAEAISLDRQLMFGGR